MATEEGVPQADVDGFSFDQWVVKSGLSALKDILIKHNMKSLSSLSTESAEFAAFISDPLLLPRAMLIPLAIQSMQQLQDSHKKQITQLEHSPPPPGAINTENINPNADHAELEEEDKQIEAEKHHAASASGSGSATPDTDHSSEMDSDDPNGLFTRYKQYKKDKAAHRDSAKGSLSSVSSLIAAHNDPIDKQKTNRTRGPSIIKENKNKLATTNKKKRKMVRLKPGDHVKFVTAKREGIVRWVGQTEFMPGICYGIEVTRGKGDCDGSPYFSTARDMGVFARRKVLRRIKPRKRTKTPQLAEQCVSNKQEDRSKWRRSVKKKNKKRKKARPATLGAVDFGTMYRERASSRKKDDDYYKKARQELKKAGPREIGKIKYKGIKTKKKKKNKKVAKKMSMNDIEDLDNMVMPKLGPRDIGKIKYDGLKLSKKEEEELSSSGFLEDKVNHVVRKNAKKSKNKSDRTLFGAKLGPQEIGKIKYKGTKLSKKQKEELRSGRVLQDRTHHIVKKKKKLHKRARSLIGTKLGPVDMGKNKGYRGTKYEDDADEPDILKEKTHVVIKKKWGMNKEKSYDNYSDEESDYSMDNSEDFEYDSEGLGGRAKYDDYAHDTGSSDDNALSLRPKRKDSIKSKTKIHVDVKKINTPRKGSKGRVKTPRKGKVKTPRTKTRTPKTKTPRQRTPKRTKTPRKERMKTPRKRKANKLKKINSSPVPLTQDDDEDAVEIFNGYYDGYVEGKKEGKKEKKKTKRRRRRAKTKEESEDEEVIVRERKEKKKKRRKGDKKDMMKYRKKLKNKARSTSNMHNMRHVYGHDSDQEYIEKIKANMYDDEPDDVEIEIQKEKERAAREEANKAPLKLVQSHSIPAEEDKDIVNEMAQNNVEIAHIQHEDTQDSDSDSIGSNGSLNALSSSEEGGNDEGAAKQWI